MKQSDELCILAINKRSWRDSQPGGAEKNLEATLKRLADRGHEVHILVGAEEHRPSVETDDSVIIHRVGFSDRLSPPWDLISTYITISICFYWYLFHLHPDVIYPVNTPVPWPIFTFRPRICIYHHLAIDSFFRTHSFPTNIIGHIIQRLGVFRDRNAPTVCVSSSTSQELQSRGHDRDTIYEIKNGVNITRYEEGLEVDKPQITYIGGLRKNKGADRIPTIHKKVNQIVDYDVRIDIAGPDGNELETIEKYCVNNKNAYFHGYVSETKKMSLLQTSWILIAPSRVEAWNIAVLEANACQTPVVASTVKGLRDSVNDGKTGLLSDGKNPEKFAKDIVKLIEDDDMRKRLGINGREWAERHSWSEATDKLELLFYDKIS